VHLAIGRQRDTKIGRWLGPPITSLGRAWENDNADPATNGEFRVLDAWTGVQVDTVFDVGAHHGAWAVHALSAFPVATIHCFEIESRARETLARVLSDEGRAVIADVGLSDVDGTLDLHVDDEFPQTTSLVAMPEERRRIVQCAVETGDHYMSRNGITSVDVLKVDTEGSDLAVLQGFSGALAAGAIGAIQFEFTLWAAIAKTWLGDFYDLLTPLDFTIGKIFPTTVEWRDYHPEDEVFVRANFLAVHNSRHDLRQALLP
jgi:FkbM family methyltransferase